MPSLSTPLSVVIITRNEARRVAECLASVRTLTDDIVVVDSGSTDGTQEICRAAGARVFERAWTGYSAQKNFGNAHARHDWILSLDADERVTPELAASIRHEFARAPEVDAFEFRFRSFLGERRVRFGAWNPEHHVRLFDRRRAVWNCDDVHEGLVGAAAVRRLPGAVLHFTAESTAQLAAKSERYGALFAQKLRRKERRVGWWKVWLNPGLRFARDYLLRLGLLDGVAGFAIAWEAARYTHLKYRWARPEPVPAWRPQTLAVALPMAAVALVLIAFVPGPGVSGDATAPGAHPVRAAAVQDDDDSPPQLPRVDDDDDVAT